MLRLEIEDHRVTPLTNVKAIINHLFEEESDVFGCESLGRLAAGRPGPEEFDSFDDWFEWILLQEPHPYISTKEEAFSIGFPLAQRWVEENILGSELLPWMIETIEGWNRKKMEMGAKILRKATKGRYSAGFTTLPLELSLVLAYLCGNVPHNEEVAIERALEAHGINTAQVIEIFDI